MSASSVTRAAVGMPAPGLLTAGAGAEARSQAGNRWTLLIAVLILGAAVVMALAAPWLSPFAPTDFAAAPYLAPSGAHPLGTDDIGHDNWARLVHGARQSLLIGVLGAAIATATATVVGLVAALRPTGVGVILMAAVDVMMALPALPTMLLVAALVQPGMLGTALVIGLLGWPVPARVLRAQGLSLAASGYVAMAGRFGGGTWYVLRSHLLPAIAPLVVATSVGQLGRAIGLEATLAFLGIGDPLRPSWGLILRRALDDPGIWFTDRWLWWVVPPSLCIALVLTGCTLLGIAVEARVDPRLGVRRG